MNERIRELAEQAGEYVNEVYSPPVRSKTPEKIWEDGHIDWHTQFNQKFAELIIQECLLALEPDLYESDIEYKVDLAFYKKSERIIKKHFGVEE